MKADVLQAVIEEMTFARDNAQASIRFELENPGYYRGLAIGRNGQRKNAHDLQRID